MISYPCTAEWNELSSSVCSSVANCSLITSSREQGTTGLVLPQGEPPVDFDQGFADSPVTSVNVPSIILSLTVLLLILKKKQNQSKLSEILILYDST